MSNVLTETAKDIFKRIKAAFDAPIQAVPATAAAPTPKAHKLQDGTEIMVNQVGDVPAVGDAVTINGAPATEGTFLLLDGGTITVDAAGIITAFTPAPVPATSTASPAAPAPAVPITQAQMEIMFAKFATGSTEDRIANLETMCKALMECSYGYQIRQASEDAAVQAYKDSVAIQVSNLMASATDKSDELQKTISRHEETIKLMFDLCEKLVEMPSADPVTLSGNKKSLFEKMSAREDRLQKMADALKKNKALA